MVETRLPTAEGEFRLIAYPPHEHLALVHGQLQIDRPVLLRLHSECLTSEVLGSLRCDCAEQLREAKRRIRKQGSGVLLYLRQEGRGIGLINKLRAYQLQDEGLDTVEANLRLGFPEDSRDYSAVKPMLQQLGVRSVRLMTNNPRKVDALQKLGFEVVERIPLEIDSHGHNSHYLNTKRVKLGHF